MFLGKLGIGFTLFFFVLLFIYFKNDFVLRSKVLAKIPFWALFILFWAIAPEIISRLSFGALRGLFRIPVIGDIFFFHASLLRLSTTGNTWGLGLMLFSFQGIIILYLLSFFRYEREVRKLKTKLQEKRDV